MKPRPPHLIILTAALILLITPLVVRTAFLGYNRRAYTPPNVPPSSMAVTPIPTITPMAMDARQSQPESELRAGPVVVDLAHFNRLNRSNFQPLAAALAERNVGLQFWLPVEVDLFALQSLADFPDQSKELTVALEDASAFIIASPFFLWTPQETAVLEAFVADGGRLLLISDPDVLGDVARDINNVGEPFGVVFNDDYLYDIVTNDKNHTHIFIDQFVNDAADLAGDTVVFYGARSIEGSGAPQARTGATTLSSLRTGLSNFVAMTLAGLEANGTAGRVLAMTDFDVLTEPYVTRFNNRQVVEHVADFLAGAERDDLVVDFPAFLGKEVTLIYGDGELDAAALEQSAKLQARLERSGRTLTLGATAMLSHTQTITAPANLIYLADYADADAQTTLLQDLGVALVEVIATLTPAPTATATPTHTPTPTPTLTPTPTTSPTPTLTPTATATEVVSGTVAPTSAPTATPTLTPTPTTSPTPTLTPTSTVTPTPSPTPSPTPRILNVLETGDGLRFDAEDTVVIVQEGDATTQRLIAILGSDQAALNTGVDRLLERDFANCVRRPQLALCPNPAAPTDVPIDATTSTPTPTPTSTTSPTSTPGASNGTLVPTFTPTAPGAPTSTPGPGSPVPTSTPASDATPTPVAEKSERILLVDDNDQAEDGETSEAELYAVILRANGYTPDIWVTEDAGTPAGDILSRYDMLIWSGGDYAVSGPGVQDLTNIFEYLNEGGRAVISSRRPFIGQSGEDPVPLADVKVQADIPALVQDLPTETIVLTGTPVDVEPLSTEVEEGEAPDVILRRGPGSGAADAAVAFVVTDDDSDDPKGARLIIMGMSLTWLPEDVAEILVRNYAEWMFEDK